MFTAQLRSSRMQVLLLDTADPQAFVGSLQQGESFACSSEYCFGFRARFVMPADFFLLGYVHRAGDNSWCQGVPLTADTAFSVMPGQTADFMFGPGTRMTHVLLPKDGMRPGSLKALPTPAEPRLFVKLFRAADNGAFVRLEKMYQQIRWKVILQSDAAYSSFVTPINLQGLVECHAAASLSATGRSILGCSRSRRRYYSIVERTEHFIRANLGRDIYLSDMCNAAEVSERTLRYAFQDLLRISPVRFLSLLRLCVAFIELAEADASRRSVKSVAVDCGMHDLSRFAETYKRFFGELPHDTLLRPPSGEWI
jgi:AraC family ethanolamine operon transcriptional activator